MCSKPVDMYWFLEHARLNLKYDEVTYANFKINVQRAYMYLQIISELYVIRIRM